MTNSELYLYLLYTKEDISHLTFLNYLTNNEISWKQFLTLSHKFIPPLTNDRYNKGLEFAQKLNKYIDDTDISNLILPNDYYNDLFDKLSLSPFNLSISKQCLSKVVENISYLNDFELSDSRYSSISSILNVKRLFILRMIPFSKIVEFSKILTLRDYFYILMDYSTGNQNDLQYLVDKIMDIVSTNDKERNNFNNLYRISLDNLEINEQNNNFPYSINWMGKSTYFNFNKEELRILKPLFKLPPISRITIKDNEEINKFISEKRYISVELEDIFKIPSLEITQSNIILKEEKGGI